MTDLENKVRAATADTTWGASSADLADMAQGTYMREDYALIMSIIWQRLGSRRWRCVYKALDVLRYLVLHGSSRVLEEARAAIHGIQGLQHYQYVDSVTRRDEGQNVRVRAVQLVQLLQDEELLDEEREKSKELRAKIGGAAGHGPLAGRGGVSADDYRFGSGRRELAGYAGAAGMANVNVSATGGAYDDDPKGGYGRQRAKEKDPEKDAGAQQHLEQSVDDLLGGGEPPAPKQAAPPVDDLYAILGPDGDAPQGREVALPGMGESVNVNTNNDDDDDDDFDPRKKRMGGAGGAGPVSNSSNVDFATQILSGINVSGSGSHAAPMSTSLLVQNLAAQKGAAPATAIDAPATPLAAMQREADEQAARVGAAAPEDAAYGGLVRFDNILLDKTTRVDSKSIKRSGDEDKNSGMPPVTAPHAKQANLVQGL